MTEVLIAIVFLVLAAILGQFLIPRVTSCVTVASSSGLKAGEWVCIGNQLVRVRQVTATSFTFQTRHGETLEGR